MKRIIASALAGALALAGIGATCTVTNETTTTINDRAVFGGELRNESGVDILSHQFRVAFLNSNLAVVETQTVDGCLRSLQNGTSNFFSATSARDADEIEVVIARLANLVEDPEFKVGQTAESDMELTDIEVARTGDDLTVMGTLTNNDNDDLEAPAVCAVVRNEDDRIVVTGKDEDLPDLEEGESAAFEVTINVPDDSDIVDEVDVWADGLEDDVPVDPVGDTDNEIVVSTPTPGNTHTATAVPTDTPVP